MMYTARAIVLTNGHLESSKAKTAHGLIRGTERYEIVGVIDPVCAGRDAGEVVDGKKRGITVFASVGEALATLSKKPNFMVIGVATKGGVLPEDMKPAIREALRAGISIVSGLHEFLNDMFDMVELARQHNARLIDVRYPKPNRELHFWNGSISKVKSLKVAVLGTDCNMGKRTTARFLTEAVRGAGKSAQMLYTGQTGWMQGGEYGFIFDSTLNDFISGEIEYWMVKCYEETKPDVIFMEGQSALQNPSGPCGTELLISGDADAVVLQHHPTRQYFQGCEGYKRKIPTLAQEIAIIKAYGFPTIAVTLNTKGLTVEQAKQFQQQFQQELGIPVYLPVEEGLDGLAQQVLQLIAQKEQSA